MSPDRPATIFSVRTDLTRRAILARLAADRATVTDLAEPSMMSLPGFSKYLEVLRRAGLFARGRRAQWRPRRLHTSPLEDASDWLERSRELWDQSFDRLKEYLGKLQAKENKHGRTKERRDGHEQ